VHGFVDTKDGFIALLPVGDMGDSVNPKPYMLNPKL